LTARADALFELTDAVLCADGPVRSLVDLTLVAEHRRGHGGMYDALTQVMNAARHSVHAPSPGPSVPGDNRHLVCILPVVVTSGRPYEAHLEAGSGEVVTHPVYRSRGKVLTVDAKISV
jgi:hypothetical protein